MPELLVDPPSGSDASALADWVELWLLVEEAGELRREAIKRRLSNEPEPEPPELDDDRAGAEIEVAEIEGLVREDRRADRVLGEIARRGEAAPRIYHLRVEDDLISRVDAPAGTTYEVLRWVCEADAPFRADRLDDVERPLDELACAALQVLVGPDARGVLFARSYAAEPPTETVRPTSFPVAIRWLRAHFKLQAGQEAVPDAPPEDDEGDHPARTYNDGGVDVVAWRPFMDGRPGFLIALGQCTIQERWRPKANDISLALWGDWIRFVTPPIKVLIIPYAVPENRTWWRDRTRMAGLIVDRMRLCELLDELTDDQLRGFSAADMRQWLDDERAQYHEAQAA